MSNFRTSLKVAILAIVGVILSVIAYAFSGIEFAFILACFFGFMFLVSLTVYVAGFLNRNITNSKNVVAIILSAFTALFSFVIDNFLDAPLFYYIFVVSVVVLLISVFVLVARKLFKKEINSFFGTPAQENTPNNVQVNTSANDVPENTENN